jgi:hypothetical protein
VQFRFSFFSLLHFVASKFKAWLDNLAKPSGQATGNAVGGTATVSHQVRVAWNDPPKLYVVRFA